MDMRMVLHETGSVNGIVIVDMVVIVSVLVIMFIIIFEPKRFINIDRPYLALH